MNFEELKIIPPLLKALDRGNFTTPTEIQTEVIPYANKWKDILGCAQTWSGKTLAFTLPVLEKLYNLRLEKGLVEWKQKRKIQALLIAPTRELVIQIWETFKPYSTNVNLKHTCIYGGVNQFHQVKAIEKWIDILIATPGRLEDLVSQWIVKLSYVEILVLDEADRMLNLGFMVDVKKVLKRVPKERQTLFFSATMPKAIRDLASSLLHCPEEVTVKAKVSATEFIEQQVYNIKSTHKRALLQNIVKKSEYKSILVFVKNKDEAEYILEYIESAWIKWATIHKSKSQTARQSALSWLKDGSIKVLIATDIASRGLDINDLSCVINWNIPQDPEDYVHRIGRTARAGKKWIAISFCTEVDNGKWKTIEKLIWKTVTLISDEEYKNETLASLQPKWKKQAEEKIVRNKNEYSAYGVKKSFEKRATTNSKTSKSTPKKWGKKKSYGETKKPTNHKSPLRVTKSKNAKKKSAFKRR